MQIWHKYGRYVMALGALLLAIIIYYFSTTESSDPPPTNDPFLLDNPVETTQQTAELEQDPPQPETVIVDVKGAVAQPGVYPFTTEQRVIDAIAQAGGYTEAADTKQINAAKRLQDEMIIYVPQIGEEAMDLSMPSFPSTQEATTPQVNINTADEAALTTIPGVGPAKAKAIISYREQQGAYQTIEDIKNVSGIGEKTFDKLSEYITVK
ncbi:helix-hairpin-helix domain-containing protein [Lysinibacillus alkalisoli]|nr:helix-hairpin-helix domain-containing protein [Lysinibacillus alkalisoli]